MNTKTISNLKVTSFSLKKKKSDTRDIWINTVTPVFFWDLVQCLHRTTAEDHY